MRGSEDARRRALADFLLHEVFGDRAADQVLTRKTGNGDRGQGTGLLQLRERGAGSGERGTGNGNGERGTGNGERGTGNGERGKRSPSQRSGDGLRGVAPKIAAMSDPIRDYRDLVAWQ